MNAQLAEIMLLNTNLIPIDIVAEVDRKYSCAG